MKKRIAAEALRAFAYGSLRSGAAAIAVATAMTGAAYAQQTFGNIGGAVTRADGGDVQGVAVEIVHTPSGTRVTTEVNAQGRYSATGLRVGGPYSLRGTARGSR